MLADYLIERGDPRGEFIMLQLVARPVRRQRARAKELFRTLRRRLVAPFAPWLYDAIVFARGFPVDACLQRPPEPGLGDVAALATLERLHLNAHGAALDQLAGNLRGLRVARGVPAAALDRLAALPPTRLEVIEIVVDWKLDQLAQLAALAACVAPGRALASLRELAITFDQPWSPLDPLPALAALAALPLRRIAIHCGSEEEECEVSVVDGNLDVTGTAAQRETRLVRGLVELFARRG